MASCYRCKLYKDCRWAGKRLMNICKEFKPTESCATCRKTFPTKHTIGEKEFGLYCTRVCNRIATWVTVMPDGWCGAYEAEKVELPKDEHPTFKDICDRCARLNNRPTKFCHDKEFCPLCKPKDPCANCSRFCSQNKSLNIKLRKTRTSCEHWKSEPIILSPTDPLWQTIAHEYLIVIREKQAEIEKQDKEIKKLKRTVRRIRNRLQHDLHSIRDLTK